MPSSTPSIRVSHHQRYGSPQPYSSINSSTGTAYPMAIPRAQEPVPPPLPPPTYIPELSQGRDPGWQWGNDPNSSDFGRSVSVRPGSSLLGGDLRSPRHEKELGHFRHRSFDDARRASSLSTVASLSHDHDMVDDPHGHHSDEDGNSTRLASNYRLQSERQLEQTTLKDSSHAYDKQLLSRIGGPNTPNRQSSVSYPAGSQEAAQLAPVDSERRNSQLRPLALPERRQSSIDWPGSGRWPSSGAISPGFTNFWENGSVDGSRAQTRQGSFQFDDGASHTGTYDHSMFAHDEFPVDESQMSAMHIHDRSPSGSEDFHKVGSKRRASSPPRDMTREERSSVSSVQGSGDLFHKRSMQHLSNRGSPVSRFHPNHSSLSSASSHGPRHGSFGSSLGVSSIPSSATSYASGRVSPSALSPAAELEPRAGTPYSGGKSLNPSPVSANAHQRTVSDSTLGGASGLSPESIAHSRQSSVTQLNGGYICECCPKKPKKFDTQDELRMHESEKQYTCAYCANRFKNKNEAERHQNSLHLRRHSWFCAALTGVESAFHSSSSGDSRDVCGYCGEEFPNPPQWDVRAEHLNQVHKYGECNKAKKFFRADHFRQHLKHSHAGTSGKWTNMLENACMKDEPPERQQRAATNVPGGQAPPVLMVTTTGLASGH